MIHLNLPKGTALSIDPTSGDAWTISTSDGHEYWFPSYEDAIGFIGRDGAKQERRQTVEWLRKLERMIVEGHAVPLGYEWAAAQIEKGSAKP